GTEAFALGKQVLNMQIQRQVTRQLRQGIRVPCVQYLHFCQLSQQVLRCSDSKVFSVRPNDDEVTEQPGLRRTSQYVPKFLQTGGVINHGRGDIHEQGAVSSSVKLTLIRSGEPAYQLVALYHALWYAVIHYGYRLKVRMLRKQLAHLVIGHRGRCARNIAQ